MMNLILNKLKLQNFKSHHDTTIEFARITNFIGLNDAGKSSGSYIPLRLILHNRNWSERWISHGEKTSTIEVEGKGINIRRERGKTQNLKITQGEDIQEYTGKKGLGEHIAEKFGIRKVVLDEMLGEEDLNFIPVKSGAFILDKSPEIVRRKVSGILGLNEAEAILKDLKARQKEMSKRLKLSEQDLETYNKNLEDIVLKRKQLAAELELEELQRIKGIFNGKELTDFQYTYRVREETEEELERIEKIIQDSGIISSVGEQIIFLSNLLLRENDKLELIANFEGIMAEMSSTIKFLNNLHMAHQDFKNNEGVLETLHEKLRELYLQREEEQTLCPECGQPILDTSQTST